MGLLSNIANTAAEDAARTAAVDAARTAAEDAARTAAVDAARTAAVDAARTAAVDAARTAAVDAARTAAVDAARTAAEDAAKTAAEDAAKTAAEDAAKTAAVDAGKKTKYIIAGVVVLGAAAATAAAAGEADRKNKIDFKISKIEDASTLTNANHPVKITFSPGEGITTKDTVTISNTNCVPIINGDFPVYSVISSTQIEIILDNKLISNGTQGDMKMHTSVGNQLALGAAEVGGTLGDVAGGVTVGVIGGTLGGLTNGLGLGSLFSGNYFYILIAIIILCISSSVGAYFI